MVSRSLWTGVARGPSRQLHPSTPYRCFSCSIRLNQDTQSSARSEATTHFGYETIAESQKASRVGEVFTSVASSYDTMNDLMSLGIHRLWKDHFVRSLNPGSHPHSLTPSNPSTRGWTILDVAGGTGDIALRLLDHATHINHSPHTRVTVADINAAMLAEGARRSLSTPYAPPSPRLAFVLADAEHMPTIPSASIDLYTVAFGIRNFTDKRRALREAWRVLRPGGVFACLEFGRVQNALLGAVYKRWSFSAIPLIGQLVAADRASYQYLVESIERFPAQPEFADMVREAGFVTAGRGWEDLSGGIAAIHKGVKPLEGST
ncbi:MAG: 2-hexaprenyl-6-methoxy-1,4-benzoquinone methyltransferase [Trizodia sp. TS-e1964]|nr:MAG: 2-hexaprenyl-6-methoxy-1,4-benzoquinone methyltransferase [Trizodia sp. TS-e1964]